MQIIAIIFAFNIQNIYEKNRRNDTDNEKKVYQK